MVYVKTVKTQFGRNKMDYLKKEKAKYAHRRIQYLAVELAKVKRLMHENSTGIQHELIGKAIDYLVRCDNLNHTNQDLDQFSMVDGMNSHQISSQL